MTHVSLRPKIELNWFDLKDQPEMEPYVCKICSGVLYKPVLLTCGDMYCKDCYISNDSKCLNNGSKCQEAKLILDNLTFLQTLFENKRCQCKNIGCNESIQLKEIFDHFSVCPKEPIKCKYGCQTQDLRHKIYEHEGQCIWRETQCEDCSEVIVYKDLETHNSNCLMKMTHCVLCHQEKLRKEMSDHFIKECVEYQRECLYVGVDCKEIFKTKDIIKHHEDHFNTHIKLYSDYLVSVKMNIEITVNQFEQKNKQTIDYYSNFIGKVDKNKEEINLDDEVFQIEEEEKELTIEQNININIDNPIFNNINEHIEEHDEEEPKSILNNVFTVSRNRGKRRSRGIRKYANRKTQIEYHNCLFTNNSFLTTSTVQIVNNNVFTIHSSLPSKEISHSLYHIIINNTHLYKDTSWVITPISINRMFYFGICVKELISNSNIILHQNLKGNHGFFGLNSNGFQYHSYSSFKNNVKVSRPLHPSKEIIIQFIKALNQLIIQFTTQDNTNQEIVIPNITIYYSNHLIVPCVLLTEKNDRIKLEF